MGAGGARYLSAPPAHNLEDVRTDVTSPQPNPAPRLRRLTDVDVPVLPACQVMLAALDADTAGVDALLQRSDPQQLALSLMKLCAFLGSAAYGADLRRQVALLAAYRDFAGEELISHD